MTIKEFAYSAQQHLQSQTGNSFKRAHVYELIASSFGYNSFAALCVESVVIEWPEEANAVPKQNLTVRQRCIELGYQPATAEIVSAELPYYIAQHQITVIKLSTLVTQLRRQLSYQDEYPDWNSEEEDDDYDDGNNPANIVPDNWPAFDNDIEDDHFSPDLLAALEAAANKGNALAHYALALIHYPDDESNHQVGSDYWYNQERQGRVLIGVEKEWADQYAKKLADDEKYELHLRKAARLCNEHALLDLADRFDDPTFFEKAKSVDHNPLKVAEIAEHLGRMEDARHWLTIAAEAGDIDSILRLIEEFDHHDLQRCWTWVYFTQLLGTDLTRDDYHAINEDGSAYDDDVGGPLYAVGREGINIAPLSENQDAVARQAAQNLFDSLQQTI